MTHHGELPLLEDRCFWTKVQFFREKFEPVWMPLTLRGMDAISSSAKLEHCFLHLCHWRRMRRDCGVCWTHWAEFSEEMLPSKTEREGESSIWGFRALAFCCLSANRFRIGFCRVFLSLSSAIVEGSEWWVKFWAWNGPILETILVA